MRRAFRDVRAQLLYWVLPKKLFKDSRYFALWQRKGVHITRVRYYSPIPDTRELPESLWQRTSELVGLDLDEAGQLERLASFESRYRDEYQRLPMEPTGDPHQFNFREAAVTGVDALVLYCMIRHAKPRLILEVGSGSSTLLAAQALRENATRDGVKGDLVAIEPYPDPILRGGFPGLTELIEAPVQDVPLSRFEALTENDILFIDSTHALRIGGDVQHEYLEILPRLRPGVLVHAHDVFLPAEYPREWIHESRFFWTEQYLLQAFLAFNERFAVLWGSHFMYMRHEAALVRAFRPPGTTLPMTGGSFWMRRVA